MIAPREEGKGVGGMGRRFAYLLGAFWFREVLQTLLVIYLARREAATFGQFFLGLSLGQLVLFVSEFGLNQHLAVLLTRRQSPPASLLAQASLLKALLLTLALAGLTAFVCGQDYAPELRWLVLILAAGMGLEALASSFYAWMQVEGRQADEGRTRAASSLAGFAHGFSTLYLGAAMIVVAAYRLLESLVALALCLRLAAGRLRRTSFWPGWSALSQNWSGGLVFTAMAGAAMLYNRFNIIYLESQAGSEAVAQYGVTWQLVDGLTSLVVGLLLKDVMLPRFLRLWGDDRQALLNLARDAAYWLLLSSMTLAFLLAVLADPLLTLLYGTAYGQAAQLQKWLALTVALGIMHNLAGYLMIAMGRQVLLLIFFLAVLGFNILACLVLIPAQPLGGAVAAIVASKALLAMLSLGFCQRQLRLVQGRRWRRLLAACLAGGLIYLGLSPWLGEAISSAPALLPVAALAWRERDAAHIPPRSAE